MRAPEEKTYQREYMRAWRARNKFEFSRISQKIYSGQRGSSRDRGHQYPDYTLEELRDWMKDQPQLETLLKNYEDSGGDRNLVPSVDRKKDELPYTLDNIQLGTWKENRDKESSKQSKAVVQMTLEGEFIKEWISTQEAGRELGLHQATISKVCNGIYNQTGGYKFKFSL